MIPSEMKVTIPTDHSGMLARECPTHDCAPGYFKIKPGTGLTGEDLATTCPYCKRSGSSSEFSTEEQIRYAKDIALREVQKALGSSLRRSFGLDSSGHRRMGGGFLSVDISLKTSQPRSVHPPFEEYLRRDVKCPHCTLEHSVFGLAVWCPDCGKDIFLTHVAAEIDAVRRMTHDIPRRRELLGDRVAAKDEENALEDVVSIFEAVMKALVVRRLRDTGVGDVQIDATLRGVGPIQSPAKAGRLLKEALQFDVSHLLGPGTHAGDSLARIFEKRHPITHNLGVIDRKYMERARGLGAEGEEIRISSPELEQVFGVCSTLFGQLHAAMFPEPRDTRLGENCSG